MRSFNNLGGQLFGAAAVWLVLIGAPSALALNGPAEVIDGDTIRVADTIVRLEGIDAPESNQTCEKRDGSSYPCGREATTVLAGLVGRAEVSCDVLGLDAYGRSLGLCQIGPIDLNATMVQSGWALAFVRYSDRFAAQEAEARSQKVGLWAGTFDPPWDWRAEQVAETAPGDCVIKGNISKEGERIYHMPFHRFYDRTKIDEEKGEKWFCSEEEALAAGWRRALQ